MATQYDVEGRPYDDAHPVFIIVDDYFYFDRQRLLLLTRESVDFRMQQSGYTPSNNEIGCDNPWLIERTTFLPNSTECPYGPDPDPLVIDVTTDELDASADFSGGVGPYEIDWGDGTSDSGIETAPATHTYDAGGDYTVTITDSEGTVVTEDITVTAPLLPLGISATISNNSATATVTNFVAPYDIDWGDSKSSIGRTTPTTTHAYVEPKGQVFTITATDAEGRVATTQVTTNANFIVSVNPEPNYLIKYTIKFGTSPYTMDYGDGVTDSNVTTTTPQHTYPAVGGQSYTLRATEAGGQIYTRSVTPSLSG